MKRKILSVLAVLMAVLMSTAALAACEKTPAGAESSGGSGAQTSTEAESSEQSALNESKNSSIIIPDEPYENEPEESKKEYVPSVTPGKKASVQADFSDLREFVLSKEAAQLVLSMTDGSFYSAELESEYLDSLCRCEMVFEVENAVKNTLCALFQTALKLNSPRLRRNNRSSTLPSSRLGL